MPEFEEKIENAPEGEQSSETLPTSATSGAGPVSMEDVGNFMKQPGFFDLLYLGGLIETVTAVPTHVPSRFEQQFKIYVDSVTAPTVKSLYFYSNKTNTWIAVNRDSLGLDTDDNVTFANITGTNIIANGQVYSPEYDAGNSGTSKTIDWNNGNVQRLTLTGNVTLTFSNLVAGGKYTLIVVQGAGPYTITWPTTAWENNTAPTLTTTNGKRDIFLFIQGAALFGTYAYNF